LFAKVKTKLNLSRIDIVFWVFVLILSLLSVWSYFKMDQQVFSLLCQKPINWHKNFWVKAFTYLGSAWLPTWLLLISYLLTGKQRPVLITLLALIVVGLMVNPLKFAVGRPRPSEVIRAQSGQEEKLGLVRHLSFPSGDAAVAFAVATVIASFVTWPLVCLLLAASTGIALLRVTAMAHYLSDVLAGAAIGGFAGWLALQIDRRLSLERTRFKLNRRLAILGIIIIPLLFGLFEGIRKLLISLKTYGLLAACIFLYAKANETFDKIFAIINSADSQCFDRILNWIRKRRTLALKIAFPIIIAENIIDGEKPHELGFPDISALAIIALILILAGALIRFWARGHFVKGQLLTTGPYAIVRHPLYLGSLLVIAGVLVQLNDRFFNLGIIVPLVIVFYGAAIIFEERSLEKRFGRQWQLYKAKTPAIIPSLQNWPVRRYIQKWDWRVYLTTGELWATLVLVSLPFLIEMIEDFVFEGMLGI